MTTESTSGLFENAKAIGWVGSSLLEKKLYRNVEYPTAYGLNRRIARSSVKTAQNRYMFGTGLWNHYNKPGIAGGIKYSSINKSPDVFSQIVMGSEKYKSLSGSKAASYLNRMTRNQTLYVGNRATEAVRRLAAKEFLTSGWKIKPAGYFDRSIWKMTASKPLARKALIKLGVGQLAHGAHKLLSAGWQAGLLYEIGSASVKMLRQQARDAKKMNWGSPFEMTEGMYTERQRAVQAITSSRMSSRAAIGGEAALLHR